MLDRVLLNALAEAFGVSDRVSVALLPGEEIVVETRAEGDAVAAFARTRVNSDPRSGERGYALCVEADGRMPRRPEAGPAAAGFVQPRSRRTLSIGESRVGDGRRRDGVRAERAQRRQAAVDRRGGAPPAGAILLAGAGVADAGADVHGESGVVSGLCVRGRRRHRRPDRPAALLPGQRRTDGRGAGPFRAAGCRFLTAGRVAANGQFVRLEDLNVPPAYRDLYQAIPEQAFRVDFSSTQLREEKG